MVKKFSTFDPQLVVVEQLAGSVVNLTNSAKLSLYKKSQKTSIPVDILEEVYRRGYSIWNDSFEGTPEQFAFDRVNSFIAGGFALQLDEDLLENWQDSKYKNPEGGLTKAGVMAYRREHPGSHLKTAVTTEPSKLKPGSKSANRRKSFCARMSGMKKRLTSAKTAHDPDSRINKSLRKWHCEENDLEEKKMMDNPCWKGYQAYGTKKKNGKTVPNCVPVKEDSLNELSPELVGKVNKARIVNNKPSKTEVGSDTLLKAVQKAKEKTKVGAAESYTGAEKTSDDFTKPNSRFIGTDNLDKVYKEETPGQSTKTIKRVVKEIAIRDAAGHVKQLKNVKIRMADGSIKSLPPGKSGSSGGGGKE